MTRNLRHALWLLIPVLTGIKGCNPPPAEAEWYQGCGDPVCQGYTGPFDGVSLCTDETAGDPCDQEGQRCDPENDCNALLICATEDPTAQTGGCPISRRKFKHDIHYLSSEEQAAVATDAQHLKIATWNYNWEPSGSKPHLGFIIDDAPDSFAVAADGNHVDLYGYSSMALAAVQAQQAVLDAQNARIAAQDARIATLEATVAALSASKVSRRAP